MTYKNFDVAGQVIDSIKKAGDNRVYFSHGKSLDIIDGKVHIGKIPVDEQAAKFLLEEMQIKKGFIKNIGPKMEDWEKVKSSLCGMFSDQDLAIYIENDTIKRVKPVTSRYAPNVYEETGKSLAYSITQITDRKINLSSSHFDCGRLVLQFVNETSHELPFGELWKTGHSVTIDPFGVLMEPYMERIICSNGMVRESKTNKYTIPHGNSPKKAFELKLGTTDYNIIGGIKDGIVRTKQNNSSVREFLEFRYILDSNPSTEVSKILSSEPGGERGGFSDARVIRSYGEDVYDKSTRWLSTADSGINAFDLINSATYIATRPEEFNIGSNSALKLQRLAAKTLMGELDLQHVAPRIN